MEIVPPSFTGDQNSARCNENSFKYAFYAVNAAVFVACVTQDSPDAAAAFLKSISERPFLVSVLVSHGQFGDNEGIIKGVCSLLLGICMAAPPSASIDAGVLESTIKDKVGLSTFLGHVNYLS